MTINELAKEVHKNAVEHGWWDDERSEAEVIALIHSEWSEALEEARAGKPLVYKNRINPFDDTSIVTPKDGVLYASYKGKPEGIAVELIDGVIRIFDWFGKCQLEATESDGSDTRIEKLYSESNVEIVPNSLPELITMLHRYTAEARYATRHANGVINSLALLNVSAIALSWVKKQGLDPLALLLEKHEYNKTRPYKHGKKF